MPGRRRLIGKAEEKDVQERSEDAPDLEAPPRRRMGGKSMSVDISDREYVAEGGEVEVTPVSPLRNAIPSNVGEFDSWRSARVVY